MSLRNLLAALFLPATLAAQLTVATAANMQPAMEALKVEFRKSAGIEVKAVYGASGRFASQIMNAAPFDVFVSADMDYPDTLYRMGYALAAPKVYAYGKLVLWTSKARPLGSDLAALLDPALAKVAIADPKRAPYGRESIRAMSRAGLYDRVKPRLVYAENIAQLSQYVMTGHADAALTAKSAVLVAETEGKGSWVELDSTLYDPIAQGAVICRYGSEKDPEAAARFHAFLFSEPARRILERFGYALP